MNALRPFRAGILAAVIAAAGLSCSSNSVAVAPGTGSETTNAFAASIVYPNGVPVVHAVVRVRPVGYLADTAGLSKRTVESADLFTDDSGRFVIDSMTPGEYLIEVQDANGRAALLDGTMLEGDSLIDLGTHAAVAQGRFEGRILGASSAIVRVHGLERSARTDSGGGFAIEVPAGYQRAINIRTPDTLVDIPVDTPIVSMQTRTVSVDFGNSARDSLAVRAFLDSTGLSAVPVDSVVSRDGTGRIMHLALTNRGLQTVHRSVGTLTFLYRLRLDSNQLRTLPAELGRLTALWHLYLNSNPLDSLPACVTRLSNLQLLEARFCGLTRLPTGMHQLTRLVYVNMHGNNFTVLPAEICRVTSLRNLVVKAAGITRIPQEIGNLVSLEELDISDNGIDSLPGGIGRCVRLRTLYAYWTKLDAVSPGIGGCAALEYANLQGNNLTSVPAEMGSLVNLRTLHLGYNQLTNLPSTFAGLDSLATFGITNNRICSPEPAVETWLVAKLGTGWKTTQVGCP